MDNTWIRYRTDDPMRTNKPSRDRKMFDWQDPPHMWNYIPTNYNKPRKEYNKKCKLKISND